MPTNTNNHGLQQFDTGEVDWDHSPDMGKLEEIIDVKRQRAPDASQETPYTDTLFFDLSTGDIYVGDGSSWGSPVWTLSSGDGSESDPTTVEGIDNRRQHVGPFHQGTYHTGSATDYASGTVFTAENLHIESAVVDSDISSVSSPDETFELRHYAGGAADPPIVDSTTVTLSGGPERVQLGFDVPASGSGDANDEYVLNRGPTTDPVPLRRVSDTDGGQELYNDHTYADPPIDFLKGTAVMDSGDFGSTGYYYYFFDLLVGAEADRTDSPWSTDIDEMYMRPRDPAEEFDVSPRSVWFDTSGV